MTSLCRHLSEQEIVNWVTTADGCGRVCVGGVYWALHSFLMIMRMMRMMMMMMMMSCKN